VNVKPNPSKVAFDSDSRGWSNTHQKTSNPQSSVSLHRNPGGVYREATTLGFRPTCDHGGDPVPCIVLDPFAGSGTVGQVARRLGRSSILIEIKEEYVNMIKKRVNHAQKPIEAYAEPIEAAHGLEFLLCDRQAAQQAASRIEIRGMEEL